MDTILQDEAMYGIKDVMLFQKKNGKQVPFDTAKIEAAISKANGTVRAKDQLDVSIISLIARNIQKACSKIEHVPTFEEVQRMVMEELMRYSVAGCCSMDVAMNYIQYAHERSLKDQSSATDDKILTLVEYENEDVKEENSNKNPQVVSVQRDYMAGEVSRDLTQRVILPKDVVDAHKEGIIHFHDSDYFVQHMYNCCLVNLEDMLQNGTVISDTMIEKPKSFSTACNIATQVIAQVASSQYGGQSVSLAHLAPFVEVDRQKNRKLVREEAEGSGVILTDEQVNEMAELRTRRNVAAGMQTIQYQVTTLMTTNGQAPFITVFMWLDEVPEGQTRDDLAMIIEEMLKQRITGTKNEKGVYVTPAFPKLIYVLDEDNVREGSKYWDLTALAAKCTAKRMVPDYISAKKMREYKGGDVYPCMGCRSFLTPDRFTEAGKGNMSNAGNYDGKRKYYGRFNQGVVTINLPYIALLADGDEEVFWKKLDEYLELCHKALQCRHERLKGTLSDVAPILWQHGAIARLQKGEKIDKLLYDGYSTISLGYAGLCETVKAIKGVSHTDEKGKPFGLAVMQRLNDKCAEWKAEENIDYSVYGTPLESTTYKFAKALQKAFGIVPGVSDKNYITNSYHVHVTEELNAFQKLSFESEFQKLSPGGAISYVEAPDLTGNVEAVLAVMQYIYENIMYAEINTKSDYCQVCGYDGEIEIFQNAHKKLAWRCPVCGNEDQNKMNVARRTCGYIGTNFWNQGRTQEIHERVIHLDKKSAIYGNF